MKTFADFRIELPSGASGEIDVLCPECSATRRKKNLRCLGVNVEKGTWLCQHCGWTGGLGTGVNRHELHWRKPAYVVPAPRQCSAVDAASLAWFARRGITQPVLTRNRVHSTTAYMPQVEADVKTVCFPYYRAGTLVNAKYRDAEKNFRMEAGAERVLYGIDDLVPDRVVIVEGEIDKLSVEVAGVTSCVSVPDGAPAINAKNYETKFTFLDSAAELLERVQQWVIAVDNDAPGTRLEQELVRRFGVGKCRRAVWPEGCKDANDVLVKHGATKLRTCIERAEPYPIDGVVYLLQLKREVELLYEQGELKGVSTGWPELDKCYTVQPGEVTVVTGTPGAGKSNFLDALMVNMASNHDWIVPMFSPENAPLKKHASRLMEKFIREPFRSGPTKRMSPERRDEALEWCSWYFPMISPSEQEDWTLDNILTIAESLLLRHGIKGLVIDPWNELEHVRPASLSETEYTGRCLKRVRQFARRTQLHVWMVAHPAKLYRNKDGKFPMPTAYDISGCYSDDTEVLTKRGWLRHSQISLRDEVACFDPETSVMTYAKPSRVICKPYSGDAHRFQGYGYDLLVTPEHRMLVRPVWGDPNGMRATTGRGRPVRFPKGQWSFCEAGALPSSSFDIPLAAPLGDASTEHVSELLAQLAGWYVSEGSAVSSGVSIAQGVGDKADQIEALLVMLSIPYKIQHSAPGGKGGTIPMKNFYIGVKGARKVVHWLREESGIGSANKKIPQAVFASPPATKFAFLRAYIAGDGCAGRDGTFRATTTSTALRDDLQRLCLELSLPCSWSYRKPVSDRHSDSWQVNIGRPERSVTALRAPRNRTIENYEGNVWCLTVPTGAYFVRRNGKAVVCGNSAHWYNKPDNVLVIHRDKSSPEAPVEVHTQKIRLRETGQIGQTDFRYNRVLADYHEFGVRDAWSAPS